MRTLAILLLAVSAALEAQVLELSPLIQGQPFALELSGAVPPADAALLVGTGGIGPGTCFPGVVCLSLLDPWVVLVIAPVDALGQVGVAGLLPAGFPLIEIDAQAVVVSVAGGTLSVAATAAVSRTVVTLASLSDPFDGTTLSPAWRLHEAGEMSPPVVAGGALLLQPTATGALATWFQDEEGPALFRPVTGDFTVTAVLHVSNPASAAPIPVPPPISYRLAGLLARDPASAPGARRSVHVALGAGDAQVPLAVEDKSTIDSVSTFLLHPVPVHDAELRLTRAGPVFTMAWRPIGGGPWSVVATHVRPDLPPTLEVGPMVYSNTAPAFIAALFDDVTFAP